MFLFSHLIGFSAVNHTQGVGLLEFFNVLMDDCESMTSERARMSQTVLLLRRLI